MPHHHCCVSVQRLLISCHVCPSLRTIVFPYSFRAGYVNIVKKKKKKKKKKTDPGVYLPKYFVSEDRFLGARGLCSPWHHHFYTPLAVIMSANISSCYKDGFAVNARPGLHWYFKVP